MGTIGQKQEPKPARPEVLVFGDRDSPTQTQSEKCILHLTKSVLHLFLAIIPETCEITKSKMRLVRLLTSAGYHPGVLDLSTTRPM